MERMTDPKCYYAGYMGFTVKEFKDRIIRLGQYEDSGLTPEEVNELACCGLDEREYRNEEIGHKNDEIAFLKQELEEKEKLIKNLEASLAHYE